MHKLKFYIVIICLTFCQGCSQETKEIEPLLLSINMKLIDHKNNGAMSLEVKKELRIQVENLSQLQIKLAELHDVEINTLCELIFFYETSNLEEFAKKKKFLDNLKSKLSEFVKKDEDAATFFRSCKQIIDLPV